MPPGLQFAPDIVSVDEERTLIELAASLPLHEARYKDYTARRRVYAFGGPADDAAPGHRMAPPVHALPPALQQLRDRLAKWAGIAARDVVHVMVAEYQTGTPLGWHRDAPHYERIVGVSLGSPARLRLRPWPPQGMQHDDVIALNLAPRSAYVLAGPARWGWQHSVPPVPGLRYSVTMRTAGR